MRPPPGAQLVEWAGRRVLWSSLGKPLQLQAGGAEYGLWLGGRGAGGIGHRREIAEVAVAIQSDAGHPREERRRIRAIDQAIRPCIQWGEALPVGGDDGRFSGVPLVPTPGLRQSQQITRQVPAVLQPDVAVGGLAGIAETVGDASR